MDHVPDGRLIANYQGAVQQTAGCVLHSSKCLGKNLIQFPRQSIRIVDLRQLAFPLRSFFPELLICQRLKLLLQAIDLLDKRTDAPDFALVL
jgi:hypothetical protein